jgi:hypothetical protein
LSDAVHLGDVRYPFRSREFSRQRAEFVEHHRLIPLSARRHDGSDGLLPTAAALARVVWMISETS